MKIMRHALALTSDSIPLDIQEAKLKFGVKNKKKQQLRIYEKITL
jgi:hypothetical protein